MFFISLYMNSEKSENESIGNITVHLYENDFQYFDELQAVFDNADNIKLIKTTEYGGGGGSKGMGVSDLVYETENGIKIYLSIDGGFPVPELAFMDFSCEKYNDTLAKELCIAFSKYYGKTFERYKLTKDSDYVSLCLYETGCE